MRTIPWLVLLLSILVSNSGCRDEGLQITGGGDLAGPPGQADLGSPSDASVQCAAYTDEPSCSAHPECEARGCNFCGEKAFLGCVPKGTGPVPSCPALPCQMGCALQTDQTSCDQTPGCTSLFNDSGTCACPIVGCCQHFDRCVSKPVSCAPTQTTGQCAAPPLPCGPNQAPVFDGACQIGCVDAVQCVNDCRTTGCAGGAHCDICWTDWVCMPAGNAC